MMIIAIPDTWLYFCITFGVVLFTSFLMGIEGKKLYTHDGATRSFSIMDLEFAANGREISNIIVGIFSLPAPQIGKVVKALKSQLYIDFLFMPAAYGSIFLLCMKTAVMLTTATGKYFFAFLAWAQLLCWLCDIAENCFLLWCIWKRPPLVSDTTFHIYRFNEWLKWGLALVGAICGINLMLYFWLTGNYITGSLFYLVIVFIEVIIFTILTKRLSK